MGGLVKALTSCSEGPWFDPGVEYPKFSRYIITWSLTYHIESGIMMLETLDLDQMGAKALTPISNASHELTYIIYKLFGHNFTDWLS